MPQDKNPASSVNGDYRSLHVRVRHGTADALLALAEYDSQRSTRKTYVTELHRAAARRYIEERTSEDPGAAAAVACYAG